jgi:hypothetical protein
MCSEPLSLWRFLHQKNALTRSVESDISPNCPGAAGMNRAWRRSAGQCHTLG